MKISKCFWGNLSRGKGYIPKEENTDIFEGRGTGRTTAYCLRLMTEAAERPECPIEIKNEPRISRTDKYFEKISLINALQNLIQRSGLDWFEIETERKLGEETYYLVYKPYVTLKEGLVIDEAKN